MTYEEAQNKSPIGVAIFGDTALKDIVWPKDLPKPYWWLGKGYSVVKSVVNLERFKTSDLWKPLEESNWKMKLCSD